MNGDMELTTDEESATLAIRRFRTQLPRLRRAFVDAAQRLAVDATAKGILRSSAFIHDMQRLCQDESARRINAARDAVKELIDGGWSPSSVTAVRTFKDCLASADAPNETYGDIDEMLRQAIATAGTLFSATKPQTATEDVDAVRQEITDEAEADIDTTARKVQLTGGSTIFHGPVGVAQIGSSNNAHVDSRPALAVPIETGKSTERAQGPRTTEDEPYVIAEDSDQQLERERRGEERIPRLHFEVCLDPSLEGIIVQAAQAPPVEPEDRGETAPHLDDPIARIVLSNVGSVTVVRLWLILPIQILTASPFPDEAQAYKKDMVIRHPVLVKVLRPGSIMLTLTNRLSSPIVFGMSPDAYEERDVLTNEGRKTVKRPLVIQTLSLLRVRASTRRTHGRS